jgi:hypothetical protein
MAELRCTRRMSLSGALPFHVRYWSRRYYPLPSLHISSVDSMYVNVSQNAPRHRSGGDKQSLRTPCLLLFPSSIAHRTTDSALPLSCSDTGIGS